MKKLALVVCVATLLAAASPAQAHHKRSVNALKTKIENLQIEVQSLRSRLFPLEQKTDLMDTDGFYLGPVEEYQVVSLSCIHGDDAVWIEDPSLPFAFLYCADGPYGVQRARGIQRFLR